MASSKDKIIYRLSGVSFEAGYKCNGKLIPNALSATYMFDLSENLVHVFSLAQTI